ncbi:HNH endonuclease family protein [Corynebacterium ulceribovis]|uniref:HNH endonuclease family protein n=1 Tax=Corynebacterium ulceribovis TaxID=487732 RepID=UPI00315C8CE3
MTAPLFSLRNTLRILAAGCAALVFTACAPISDPAPSPTSESAATASDDSNTSTSESLGSNLGDLDSFGNRLDADPSRDAEPEQPDGADYPELTGTSDSDIAQPASQVRPLLAQLQVKGRAPKTGYSRDFFGQAWTDDVTVEFGHNGCDTRNDILRRDLTNIEIKPNTNDCVAKSGTLIDPYSGKEIAFVRGPRSSEVQIDHVVPLADAYQKGAQGWDEQKRKDFANDPLNLLAVDGPLNQKKGAGDAATWLPPAKSYRCLYATRLVLVKAKYDVWVTQAEHDALSRQLDTCAEQ